MQFYPRAAFGASLGDAGAAGSGESGAHVFKAVFFRASGVGRQAAAVVFEANDHHGIFEAQCECEDSCTGMLDDILQRFFESEEELVPLVRPEFTLGPRIGRVLSEAVVQV
jgi:hypothetical protein